MKNIHILATNKPSKFWIDNDTNKLVYGLLSIDEICNCKNLNIYITSDEEIKGGDWCLGNPRTILKVPLRWISNGDWKKIILTTDQDLIKDGVQAIDDEFLEWFVKNPSCESIEVEKYHGINTSIAEVNAISGDDSLNWEGRSDLRDYKIIIPKEELSTKLHKGEVVDESYPEAFIKKEIDTCKNFDIEVGCGLVDCPCERKEILEVAKQMMVTQKSILEQIALTESRGKKIVEYLNKYKGDLIYNEIALAIEFGYQFKLEEDEKKRNA